MRSGLRPWSATLAGSTATAAVLVVLATALGSGEALTSVGVALAMFAVVGLFSLPVLGAMGIAPGVAFMVAMTTYALQVLLGALLLRAGSPGGELEDTLDTRWLGLSVIALAVVVTAGVVTDQLQSARSSRRAETAEEDEGRVTSDGPEPERR